MPDIESLGRPEVDHDTLKHQNSEQLVRELMLAVKMRRRSWYLLKKPTLELREAVQLMDEVEIWSKRVNDVTDILIGKLPKDGKERGEYERYLKYLKKLT